MTRRHTGVPLGITALNGQACRNDMAIMRWGKWLMAVWFTADTHFGHAGALALYRRAFPSIAEMNAAMIARWNETVGPADDVWHLGDFALRTSAEAATDLLRRLNGRKHLITGNNDPPAIVSLPDWSSVQAYIEVTVDGYRLVLCHYAFRTWNGMAKAVLNLHGHSHGRLKPLPRQTESAWMHGISGRSRRRGYVARDPYPA